MTQPDPLDRWEERVREGSCPAGVLALVEIARAARRLTTLDGNQWLPRFKELVEALARLEK